MGGGINIFPTKMGIRRQNSDCEMILNQEEAEVLVGTKETGRMQSNPDGEEKEESKEQSAAKKPKKVDEPQPQVLHGDSENSEQMRCKIYAAVLKKGYSGDHFQTWNRVPKATSTQ